MTQACTTPADAADRLRRADPAKDGSTFFDRCDLDVAMTRLERRIEQEQPTWARSQHGHGRTSELTPGRFIHRGRRGGRPVMALATAGAAIAAVGIVLAVDDGGSRVPIAVAETLRGARAALAPFPPVAGAILHISYMTTQHMSGTVLRGVDSSGSYDSWVSHHGAACTTRSLIRVSSMGGFADGVEVQDEAANRFTDQTSSYDSLTNTITESPTATRSRPADRFACDTSGDAATPGPTQIRRQLASGHATVVGPARVNGINVIEIRYSFHVGMGPDSEIDHVIYDVRANGSYAPVESISTTPVPRQCPMSRAIQARLAAWLRAHPEGGRPPAALQMKLCGSEGVQTNTVVFDAYAWLPASDRRVFDLSAVYPTAKVISGTTAGEPGGR